jgi:leucyl/phenylalanyl-tRNA--protein transferase
MAIIAFPPVENADPSGLIAAGGDLEVSSLKLAYSSGIFPWPHEGYPLLWFAPPKRAILDFDEFRASKRLQRYLKKAHFTFRVDGDFPSVIRACSRVPRPGQDGTWITQEITTAFIAFHKAGYAHSFETLNEHGKLVGGLYGVKIGRMFCGESMFYREPNASKFAFIEAVHYLQDRGSSWMDVQILTPLLKGFGAKEVDRAVFMAKLKKAIA